MPDISDALVASDDALPAPARPPISVLAVRRRYWEKTHGWLAPALPQEAPDSDAPGRVA